LKSIKTISFYIVLSLAINLLCALLKTDFLGLFLYNNIVVLLITLLAINTATSSLIAARLSEISENTVHEFKKPFKEMRIALTEQIVLIIIAIALSILNDSPIITRGIKNSHFISSTLITVIFIYSLDILRDTGQAIFIAYSFKNKNKGE